MAQFIPHGAISSFEIGFVTFILVPNPANQPCGSFASAELTL